MNLVPQTDDALNFLLRRSLMTDDERENAIAACVLQFHAATTPSQRRKFWAEFKRLHEGRSPEKVEEIERERGIYTEGK